MRHARLYRTMTNATMSTSAMKLTAAMMARVKGTGLSEDRRRFGTMGTSGADDDCPVDPAFCTAHRHIPVSWPQAQAQVQAHANTHHQVHAAGTDATHPRHQRHSQSARVHPRPAKTSSTKTGANTTQQGAHTTQALSRVQCSHSPQRRQHDIRLFLSADVHLERDNCARWRQPARLNTSRHVTPRHVCGTARSWETPHQRYSQIGNFSHDDIIGREGGVRQRRLAHEHDELSKRQRHLHGVDGTE
jgi:hypothetical protein